MSEAEHTHSLFGMKFDPALGSDGQPFVKVTVQSGFTEYTFAIPGSYAGEFIKEFDQNFFATLAAAQQEAKNYRRAAAGLDLPAGDGAALFVPPSDPKRLAELHEAVLKAAESAQD